MVWRVTPLYGRPCWRLSTSGINPKNAFCQHSPFVGTRFRQFPLNRVHFSLPSKTPGEPSPIVIPASNPATPSSVSLTTRSWVERTPSSVRPYLELTRIDKPIGTMLLFYPCAWSITMASYSLHSSPLVPLTYLGLFGAGALVMRSAGCTINDMWDRNLDKAVERTKDRPLARGDITQRQALGFLAFQLSAGLGILTQLNWYSILLGASSLSVVTIYPLMKRITYWPQFVLGLAFNWGAMLGWSAVAGAVDWTVCLPLYAGSILWTLVYDTIYAHQDKRDDVSAGIRSTALLFGDRTKAVLATFSAASLSLISLAGYLNNQGLPFFGGVGLAGLQLFRVLWETKWNDRASCWKGFVKCGWVGIWIWMGATVDYIWITTIASG